MPWHGMPCDAMACAAWRLAAHDVASLASGASAYFHFQHEPLLNLSRAKKMHSSSKKRPVFLTVLISSFKSHSQVKRNETREILMIESYSL